MLRLFGFDIRFHVSFWMMGAVLAFPRSNTPREVGRALSWLVVVTVSVLVHELGHAFAARALGRQPRIELYSLGGVTIYDSDAGLSHAQRIWISVAGPLAGFALGGVVLLLQALGSAEQPLLIDVTRQLLWANIGWGALNLLPMLPLDGGHILRTGVDALTRGKGATITYAISIVTAAIAFVVALQFHMTWAAFIAGWGGVDTYRDWQRERAQRHDEPLRRQLEIASDHARNGDDAAAARALEIVLREARSESMREDAAVQLAWRQLKLGQVDAAAATLALAPSSTSSAPLVVGTLLDAQRRYSDAVPVLRAAIAKAKVGSNTWHLAADTLTHALVGVGDVQAVLDWARESEHAAHRQVQAAVTANLFHAGHYVDAAEICERAFAAHGCADDAYNAACCYARMARRESDALGWLERAISAGYNDTQHLDSDSDLESVRALPDYARVRGRVG